MALSYETRQNRPSPRALQGLQQLFDPSAGNRTGETMLVLGYKKGHKTICS